MVDNKRSAIVNICIFGIIIISFILIMNILFNKKNQYSRLEINALYFLFTYYASVFVHELAHSIAFLFFNMQIRAICIFPFCFVNNAGKWEMKINWNKIGLGGATVPNQGIIKNDNDFVKTKKAFAYSMLTATIASIVVLIVGAIFMLIGYNLHKSENLITIGSFFIIVNFIIGIGCFTKSNNSCGDFFAYKYLLKDDDIVTQLMYSYIILSYDYVEIRNNNDYLRKRLIECFEKKVKDDICSLDAMVIVLNLITEFLIYNINLPSSVLEYFENINEKNTAFKKNINTEVFKKFITKLAFYYEFIGRHEEALEIFWKYIVNFSNSDVDKYRKVQSQQIIFHEDNMDFLLRYSNIKPDSLYSFYRIFDGYIADELALNGAKKLNIPKILDL